MSPLRLQPGVRVVQRSDGRLQVGFHDDRRVVARDTPAVRRLLTALAAGATPARGPETATLVDELSARGLLRTPVTGGPRVELDTDLDDGSAAAAFRTAGLATGSGPDAVAVLLTRGAEPRRERTDALMREDRPHLLLTQHSGVTRLGPFVSPGRTACLRCLDAHAADRDPGHAVVLSQHHDPLGFGDAADWQLGLAMAAREVQAVGLGRRPPTWSSTVDLSPGRAPALRSWTRHPRCGCAWGDALSA